VVPELERGGGKPLMDALEAEEKRQAAELFAYPLGSLSDIQNLIWFMGDRYRGDRYRILLVAIFSAGFYYPARC
jgi:hypothetical protein